jgi:hypothetical protein
MTDRARAPGTQEGSDPSSSKKDTDWPTATIEYSSPGFSPWGIQPLFSPTLADATSTGQLPTVPEGVDPSQDEDDVTLTEHSDTDASQRELLILPPAPSPTGHYPP